MHIDRNALLDQLNSTDIFDVAVIGGGASGLGIALDAASRGMRTVLFEQSDFAKGTSSRSTKLVHGGVRYLAQGQIGLVREALVERGLIRQNAAHLFRTQEFVIPGYKWWSAPYYTIGLKLYDLLGGKWSIGPSRWISRRATIQKLPTIRHKGLNGGVTYYDGRFDDARLALNIAQTALKYGALTLNYMKVVGFLKEGDTVRGLEVRDQETRQLYTVHARVVVNATGVFTDRILKLKDPAHKKTVIPSQGIHLVLNQKFLQSKSALMIPKTSDGRVLFAIPWHGKVIVGTTDTLIKKPKMEPAPLANEIQFILDTMADYLDVPPQPSDVLAVFSGLRPLAKPKKGDEGNTKEVSRSHKITVEGNVMSIIGGKWTTYRKMAEDTVDQIARLLGVNTPCKTREIQLHGCSSASAEDNAPHWYVYGCIQKELTTFINGNTGYDRRLHPDYELTEGEVRWFVRCEMARTVEDVLARRYRLLFLDVDAALAVAPRVAALMAEELDKPADWAKAQTEAFQALALNYQIPK